MSLVEQTCRVIIIPEGTTPGGVDFSGSQEGIRCAKPFFGYVHEDVPACAEHCRLHEEFLSFLDRNEIGFN